VTKQEEIPQFKTLEEEKAYWEARGPFGIEAQQEEIKEENPLVTQSKSGFSGIMQGK